MTVVPGAPAPSIPLASIQPAFEGIVPSTIASCSEDGVPNVSYLSVVRLLDSERIAITNQFFTKTTANVRHNPHVLIRVVHPDDLTQYDISARFLHSETSGELFESVRVQLDAIAAQTGGEGTFRLRSVDVFRVEHCARVADMPPQPRPREAQRPLSALSVLVRRLAASGDLAEATRVGLDALDDLFGFRHSMVLLTDERSKRLFVIDAHGYDSGRVGAEIAIGEGVIGVAAQRRHTVRVANLSRSRMMNAAASGADLHEVPLRGLDDALSMIAAPMMLRDRLIGVLYLDSRQQGTFDADAAEIVEVVAGHLALTIALLEAGGSEPPDAEPRAVPLERSSAPRTIAFHESDGSVFLDGDYLIRGVPGRILASMLSEHIRSGRTHFSNKELRLDRSIELPAGNDNLEARLLVLRRRLAERGGFIAVERVGRGRIELAVGGPIELQRHGATHR